MRLFLLAESSAERLILQKAAPTSQAVTVDGQVQEPYIAGIMDGSQIVEKSTTWPVSLLI